MAVLRPFLSALPPERDHVVEFRHPSWYDQETIVALREAGAGFCCVDGHGMPPLVEATARVGYVRFHGSDRNGGNYDHAQLAAWAERIRGLGDRCEAVYAYFNNDWEGFALGNALSLREMLTR
jgi:uncharacterized protein YecE (DUF72 family)